MVFDTARSVASFGSLGFRDSEESQQSIFTGFALAELDTSELIACQNRVSEVLDSNYLNSKTGIRVDS